MHPLRTSTPGLCELSPELLVSNFSEEWFLFQHQFQNRGFGGYRVDRGGSGWLNQAPGEEGQHLREGCQRATDREVVEERCGGRGVAKQSHMVKLRGSCELSSICKIPSGWLKLRYPGKQGKHEQPWAGLEVATKAAPWLQITGCHHVVISCETCSCRKASQVLSQSWDRDAS